MAKDGKTDKLAILETVFDLLRSFTQFISYSNEAAELKTLEFYILLYIGLKGLQNMSALAKAYLMTKSNVTVLVDDLENKSYFGREIRYRQKSDDHQAHAERRSCLQGVFEKLLGVDRYLPGKRAEG